MEMTLCIDVAVKNMRTLKDLKVSLPYKRATVFVGTNNSGKTTLLTAIRAAFYALPSATNAMSSRMQIVKTMYRREASRTLRPEVNLTLPVHAVLGKEISVEDGRLTIDLFASRTAVGVDSGQAAAL